MERFLDKSSHVWPKKEKKTITVAKSRELKGKELIAREMNKIKKVSQKVNADDRPLASLLLDDVHASMQSPHF